METDESVVDSVPDGWTPGTRLLLATLGIGLITAVGTALVALGLTDLLAYADGYRPSHWMVSSYATALLVTALGWSLVAAAVLWTVHATSLLR